MPPNLY